MSNGVSPGHPAAPGSTSGESVHSADDEGSRDGEASKEASNLQNKALNSPSKRPGVNRRANRTWKHFYEEVTNTVDF